MKILAIDPGENIGYAVFEGSVLKDFGVVKCTKPKLPELYVWTSTLATDFDIVVIERYMIRPQKAGGFDHSWNSGLTLQVIGTIKGWAAQHGIAWHEQNSDILTPAHSWVYGKPYKKKKGDHWLSAMLHGVYYHVNTLKEPISAFRSSS